MRPGDERAVAPSDEELLAEALEGQILRLLSEREPGRTICPSEAARAVWAAADRDAADQRDDGWRALMDPARQVAARLVESGAVVVTQGGEVVDPATARGPIRLRRA